MLFLLMFTIILVVFQAKKVFSAVVHLWQSLTYFV